MMPNSRKGPLCNCRQRRFRLACASVQSVLGILCSSTYTTVSTDSVSGQQRHLQYKNHSLLSKKNINIFAIFLHTNFSHVSTYKF